MNLPLCDAEDPRRNLLRDRRSQRKFASAPLQRSLVEEIIGEAAWAPSGGNLQPWRVGVLGPDSVRTFLGRYEQQSADWIQPMVKLALAGLARREGREPPANLNQRVVSHVVPGLTMADAPPSHLIVVYEERPSFFERMRALAHGASLVWYRLRTGGTTSQRLRYLWGMVSRLRRLMATDQAVRMMSLSNFTYALTLAARSRSVDSCIQCHFLAAEKHVHRLLSLGRRDRIFACVSLGYPREAQGDDSSTSRFPTSRYAVPTKWTDSQEPAQERT